MPAILQQLRRETGAAGKPGAAGQAGQIAINFAASPAQVWAFSASLSDWILLNPPGAQPNVVGYAAGTDQGTVEDTFNADAITVAAGDIVVYTYGGAAYMYTGSIGAPVTTAAAGDFTSLGGAVTFASAAQVVAGTDATNAINSALLRQELSRITGIPAADLAAGAATVVATTGATDAGKIPALNASGVIDVSMLPANANTFLGAVDVTAPPALNPDAGDMMIVGTGGTADAGWGLPAAATLPVDALLIYDGNNYVPIVGAKQLAAYLPLLGGAMDASATIVFNPTAPQAIIDGTDPANARVENVSMDAGTY